MLCLCIGLCACSNMESIEDKLKKNYDLEELTTREIDNLASVLSLHASAYNIKSAVMATHKTRGTGVMIIECGSQSDATKLFREAEGIIGILKAKYGSGYTFTRDRIGSVALFGEQSAVRDAHNAVKGKSNDAYGFWFWIAVWFGAGVVCGVITKKITSDRGYYGGFAWGFFLNVIGIMIVFVKTPDASTKEKSEEPKCSEESILKPLPPSQNWTCSCGRTNAHYVSSCCCGRNKKQNLHPTPVKTPATTLAPGEKQPVPISKATPSAKKEADVIELIKRYKELLDSGVITQEEFDAKKKQLLNL